MGVFSVAVPVKNKYNKIAEIRVKIFTVVCQQLQVNISESGRG